MLELVVLDGTADGGPTWVVELDVGEALAPGDEAALRHAVRHGALDPTKTHFLRDLVRGEPAEGGEVWAGRLTARPPCAAPSIDVDAHDSVRTTLRLVPAGTGAPRPPCLPVVPNTPWPAEAEEAARHPEGEPLLSVVVVSKDDEAVIARSVRAIVGQDCDAATQVIVVTSGTDRTAEIVRTRFPQVELVELDHPALPGEARNAGLRLARGRYVTFPGSHIELAQGSLRARLGAHLAGWVMVTGSTLNGTRTWAGWASYFVDHSQSLPRRPSEALAAAPSSASFLTAAVRSVGGYPEHMLTAEDTVVNTELFALGYGAWREQGAAFIHHSPCRSPRILVRHHYRRGRGFGQMILQRRRPGTPVLDRWRLRTLGTTYVVARMHRVHTATWRDGGELRARWLLVSPLAAVAVVAAWVGAWSELLRPRPGWREELFADRLTIADAQRRWRRRTAT